MDELAKLRERVKELEKELSNNRERLGILFEHAPDAVYLNDLKGVFIDANKAAAELIGCPRDELLGLSMLESGLLTAKQLPLAAKLLAENALGKVAGPAELRLNRKDGSQIVVEIRSYPVRLPEGVVVMGIARDITRRDAVESALRESEEQLRAVVESAADAVVMGDHRARIRVWNEAACNIFGYAEGEVVGEPMEMLIPERHRGRGDSAFGRILAGCGDHLLGRTFELEGLHKDGREFPLEMSVSAWRHGPNMRFTAIIRDVSERKAAERALELERAYFEELFHSSPEGIVLIDETSRILRQNEEFTEMFGFGPEETRGKCVDDLLAPEELRDTAKFLTKRAVAKENISVETVRKTKSGRSIDVSILAAPIRIVEENVAVLAIYRDITEQKRAEEVVREMQKLDSLSVMAGGIAHDFNNLLVSVLGNAELALMDLDPDDPTRELIESIERSAHRATDLTSQMLAYSGKGKFQVAPLDPSALIEDMKKWLKVGSNKSALVSYNLPSGLPRFDGDSAQIRQAVSAVFTNAIEALEDQPGQITVSTGVESLDRFMLAEAHLADDLPEGEYVFIRVSDTGKGIDEETRKRMFDPFFSTRFTGRGLGLPAALGIMRGHDGTLHVETEDGSGTTVTAYFPIAEASEAADSTSAGRAIDTWKGTGTVLVVDDEAEVRSVAQAVLEKWGFHVVQAADGREAVEVFHRQADDIEAVLLDFTMPQMNGDEAFLEMHRRNPEVPVILMSGFAEEDAVSDFSERGLAGFIHKPFHPTVLVEKLKLVLGQ